MANRGKYDPVCHLWPAESFPSLIESSCSVISPHFFSSLHSMRRFSMKMEPIQPPLLRLPDEILEEIFSEIDSHADLVSFALASRLCHSIVAPHHTQYRILRVRHSYPNIWAHLARRSDLARNLREVHIHEPNSVHAPPDRIPTTLIDDHLDKGLSNADETTRIRNMCCALGHMQRLQVFSWSCLLPGAQRPTSHPTHENAVLTAVVNLPELSKVSLSGKFALHALDATRDSRGSTYPLWRLSNLTSLSLHGEAFTKVGNAKHVGRLLTNSPNLERLKIPMEFSEIQSYNLPCLKKLTVKMQYGSTNTSLDDCHVRFLKNHPSIEDLDWIPIQHPKIPLDLLPNLRSLRSGTHFATALSSSLPTPRSGSPAYGLMTPPSTPVTNITPVPAVSEGAEEEESPLPTPIKRSIENLDLYGLTPQSLLELKCLDPLAVRRLKLHSFGVGEFSALSDVAEKFPNIKWLSLPSYYLPRHSPHPLPVSREQWLDILPRFTKLQVFRGPGLWYCVKSDKQSVHEIIMHLVQTNEHLRCLDRVGRHNEVDPSRQIVISRQGEGGKDVSYKIETMLPRQPFDINDQEFS